MFSLPLNTISEFANIRNVKVSITKCLGAENRGDAGRFGATGGTPNGVVNDQSYVGNKREDATGWVIMSQPSGTTGTSSGEQTMVDPSNYLAQRFICTTSSGAFLFVWRGRATSASSQGVLACSIWSDGNINGIPCPGEPLVGNQGDITYNFSNLNNWNPAGNKGGLFNLLGSKFTSPTGWVEIPTNLITHTGGNAVLSPLNVVNPLCVEIAMQQPISPGTNLWFVMRVQSAGVATPSNANIQVPSIWIMYGDSLSDYPAMQSTNAGRGTTTLDKWKKLYGVGGTLQDQRFTNFGVYALAPICSFGTWQPSGVNSAHNPGTQGISSAGTGDAQNLNLPILPHSANFGGLRQDIGNSTRIGLGSGIYSIEPVTGEHFVAISAPGTETTVAQIEFPTSFVATREAFGNVFVSIPFLTSGGGIPSKVFKRVDYTMEVGFNEF